MRMKKFTLYIRTLGQIIQKIKIIRDINTNVLQLVKKITKKVNFSRYLHYKVGFKQK